MTTITDNPEARRHHAAFALEDLSKRQQRAAISNLQRAIFLRTDDPASHQRALASLRQSIGHKVPGWHEMVIALSLLTGEDLIALMEKADKGGKSRLFIDGLALTSDELDVLRLWRKSHGRRQIDAICVLETGLTSEGKAVDAEKDCRAHEVAEREHDAMVARSCIQPFRVIDGGAHD